MNRQTRAVLLVGALSLASACLHAGSSDVPSRPFEFDTEGLLLASMDMRANQLAAKMRRSACGKPAQANAGALSGLAITSSGWSTRVERGRDGNAYWFVLRSEQVPVPGLCGVWIEGDEAGHSSVLLYGVPERSREAALKALRKGQLFCECESLAR
jgi:hypothetical protein